MAPGLRPARANRARVPGVRSAGRKSARRARNCAVARLAGRRVSSVLSRKRPRRLTAQTPALTPGRDPSSGERQKPLSPAAYLFGNVPLKWARVSSPPLVKVATPLVTAISKPKSGTASHHAFT